MDKKKEIYYRNVTGSLMVLAAILIYLNVLVDIYDVILYVVSTWLGVALSIIYFNKRRSV